MRDRLQFPTAFFSTLFQALLGSMEHWVGVFPRDFAQREFLDRFNQICKFVGEINMVRYKALLVQSAGFNSIMLSAHDYPSQPFVAQ